MPAAHITKWIKGWKRRGWKRSDGQPLKHPDLWKAIWEQMQRHEVRASWTKGHNGNRYNQRAHDLASRQV